jgi:hypothetical protein
MIMFNHTHIEAVGKLNRRIERLEKANARLKELVLKSKG